MRDWLNSILGQDGGRIAQFVLALIAVLLLVLLVAWVARRLLPGDRIASANSGKSRKRLGVLEASDVDARRRLVLVRRDDVEHLIMIGGPNDLLIESRILRGQQAMRPSVQPGQRPQGVIEPDRPPVLSQQQQPAVTAPTAPTPSSVQLAPLAVTSSPMPGSDGDHGVKPDAPTSPPAPPPVQFAASNTAPSMLRPMVPTTPKPTSAQISPEPRRASMNDLLNAAAAARQSDQRELPQPITVPPPPPRSRQPQPDLEEDDREMPTQIVSHRPMQPPPAPVPTDKPVERADNRATDVSTQIERALADLNPLVDETMFHAEPKIDLTPVAATPVRQQSPTLGTGTAPVSTTAIPSMPSIAPRPTPLRPPANERPSLADRPPLSERPPLPDRFAQIERTAPQLPDRPPTMERAPGAAAPHLADEGTGVPGGIRSSACQSCSVSGAGDSTATGHGAGTTAAHYSERTAGSAAARQVTCHALASQDRRTGRRNGEASIGIGWAIVTMNGAPAMSRGTGERCTIARARWKCRFNASVVLCWMFIALSLGLTVTAVAPASAQDVSISLGQGNSVTERSVQLIGLMTVLSIAPSIMVMVTSFTRMVVVLSLLRSAMGLQTAPPNSVMISLALFLTAFVMQPTFQRAYDDGIKPLTDGSIELNQAIERTAEPFHEFMSAHVREKDVALFLDLAKEPPPKDITDLSYRVLIPAFMISELKRAFEIGFLLYLPFLIIDLVVASVLMSMGMMMLPPVTISLPFKLIFFVLVDGWALVAGSLVKSFGT